MPLLAPAWRPPDLGRSKTRFRELRDRKTRALDTLESPARGSISGGPRKRSVRSSTRLPPPALVPLGSLGPTHDAGARAELHHDAAAAEARLPARAIPQEYDCRDLRQSIFRAKHIDSLYCYTFTCSRT